MVKMLVDHFGDKVEVKSFDGLLIDFMKQNNADIIIRGLRAVSDFEYELGYAFVNHDLHMEILRQSLFQQLESICILAQVEFVKLQVLEPDWIFVDDKLIDIIREKAKKP